MALSLVDKLVLLKSKASNNYYASRITAQIGYALKLSAADGGKYDKKLEAVADFLVEDLNKNGAVTIPAAKEAEQKLSFMSELAKKTEVICVSHAHIDMNWMWGYQETTATTVDTFRTVLDLMNEYPEFTYSQSQASVYKIIEEHAPDMLDEIKARVKEGRWEITASTWVETDKNMPNGESLARHILYTKRYLSKLLDVPPESMQLDFEPDTFGHNWTVPEILNKGGVKYYYHCRAFDDETVYKWQSRNGAEVLVYKDPDWYNATIDPDMFFNIPQFCKQYGTDVWLKVYGVGDHGGGPTRRDVEIIADMMSWPVMPVIKFGTYHEFFKKLETHSANFPTVNKELNFVFTGCYTSQSRIKMSNRISEDRLYESEALSAAAAAVAGGKPQTKSFSQAWEKVLFNHFHDIITGSGVIDTREYAMGEFQKVLAAANTNATLAMRTLSAKIDTSGIPVEIDRRAVAEGAGVGFATEQGSGYKFPQTERGNGKVRIFHLFNTTEFEREAPAEITVWDWHYDIGQLSIKDSAGTAAEWKLTQGQSGYWGHNFFKIVFMAKIPALGYATYVLTEEPRAALSLDTRRGDRCDYFSDDDIVLENDKIKATFGHTMMLQAITDKRNGKTVSFISAGLSYVQEDDVNGMTSWRVGPRMHMEYLNHKYEVRVYDQNLSGIRKWVQYEIKFRNSKVNVRVSLDNNSETLKFDITADWHEVGRRPEGIPQLNFGLYMLSEHKIKKYRYDIPFAAIDRDEKNIDMPGNSYAVTLPETNSDDEFPIMLVTGTKYGFRTIDNSIAVNLIRSSYDPDPYPEYGIHNISLGVAVPEDLNNKTLAKIRGEFIHPAVFVSGTKHSGSLPLDSSMFKLSGDVILSAVKTAEDSKDGKTVIIRLYDANGNGASAALDFTSEISGANVVDLNENPVKPLTIKGRTVSVNVPAYEVITLAVEYT
ncbi:MAG: glycosyl hydrolase-related protein [Oscillospiraceae bacterium]|nr:glycosyl hydrolase-related protein [Oscillospiraceae bacterium]